MNSDAELLRRYVREDANDAFTELVHRHINLVYSVALRQVNGDAHLAADATQAVFADLARKAGSLINRSVLAGWFFTSARYAAANLVRSERRRHNREQEAQLMTELSGDHASSELDWEHVRPVLNDVLAQLNETDREAILLRFFDGRDYAAIATRLNVADNTARMRVERALDKLRARLERQGVTSTSAALAAALAQQAVIAAPPGLAATISGTALSGAGAAAAGSSVLLGSGMTKLQLGLSGALAAAALTTGVIQLVKNSDLRSEVAAAQHENVKAAALRTENVQLAQVIAEMKDLKRDDDAFAQVQEQAGQLRRRLQKLARAPEAIAAGATRGIQVYDVSRVDQKPTPEFQLRPDYPFALRERGVSAEVLVDFIVDGRGNVRNAHAVRSSARPSEPQAGIGREQFVVAAPGVSTASAPESAQAEFELAAVEAVSNWLFRPGMKAGRAVATHHQVPIVFTLSDDDPAGQRKTASGKPPTNEN